jgi:hypothetical protein
MAQCLRILACTLSIFRRSGGPCPGRFLSAAKSHKAMTAGQLQTRRDQAQCAACLPSCTVLYRTMFSAATPAADSLAAASRSQCQEHCTHHCTHKPYQHGDAGREQNVPHTPCATSCTSHNQHKLPTMPTPLPAQAQGCPVLHSSSARVGAHPCLRKGQTHLCNALGQQSVALQRQTAHALPQIKRPTQYPASQNPSSCNALSLPCLP